jgi:hypothetical protein
MIGLSMAEKKNDQFSEPETKRRMEAALRGARIAGPKPMKDIAAKRSKRPRKTRSRQA